LYPQVHSMLCALARSLPMAAVSDAAPPAIRVCSPTDIDGCEEAIRTDGAVIITGLFTQDMVEALTEEHDKTLVDVDAQLVGKERLEAPYLNGMVEDGKKQYGQQGYYLINDDQSVLDLGKGRIDVSPLETGLWNDPAVHAPPSIAEIARRMLKADYAHFCGAVPSREKADAGIWHRDTYSLFDDDALDVSLPPFYLTVLCPLSDITEDLGPTELHLGSHKRTLKDAKTCPLATACPLKAGDALVFDGRCLHRGLANTSTDLRRMVYCVWHKKWYNDYSDFGFAPGYSVCEPEEPPKKLEQ